jgi:hypothetical protein
MQVPDEMRKSVVFPYYRANGEQRPAGTAFFGGYPVPGYRDKALPVLLTAHHVIAGIRQASDDGKTFIRLNARSGGAVFVEVPVDDWHHGDPQVDCAMLPWLPDPE